MKQIKIKRSVELTSGGCNACPTVASDCYVIEINGIDRPLEELDVASLLVPVVLGEGFKQHQEYDLSEDYDVYKKEGKEITVMPAFNQLVFKSGRIQEKVMNRYENSEELFSMMTQVLAKLFGLVGYQFIMEDQK